MEDRAFAASCVQQVGPTGAISRAIRVWRAGGVSAVAEKMRRLAALELPTLRGSMTATSGDGSRGFLQLGEDFGVDLEQWQCFLSYRATASGGERGGRSGVWILVSGSKGSTKAEATLRSIRKQVSQLVALWLPMSLILHPPSRPFSRMLLRAISSGS